MAKKVMFAVCAFSIVCMGNVFAEGGTIGHLFDGKSPVKVYVSAVTNESGQNQLSTDEFRKTLEDSLNKRKAIDFDTVDNPVASDIQIAVIISKYQYLKRGPFKPGLGIGTTLADAAATATLNYVEMEALFTITDTKSGEILWTDDVSGYIKRIMTPKKSIPLIYDKISRTFIWRSFGRAHKKGTTKQSM